MKKTILSILFSLLCLSGNAQTTLNIHQKSGGVVGYAFREKPVVTYEGSDLIVNTTKVKVVYPISNLEMLNFDNGEAAEVESVTMSDVKGKTLVYTSNGVLVKELQPEDGSTHLLLEGLSNGIYIIKNGNTTYKIIKK